MLVGLEKITLVNFPNKVASAIFLPGCNMRCGFCHNAELALASSTEGVKASTGENQYYTLEEVFQFLEKRKKVLSGVVVTGGEPFASPFLHTLIEKIKELGFALKIDTNGLYPEKLKEVLLDEKLSPKMVALDVKTSPKRYIELMDSSVKNAEVITKKLLQSLDILASYMKEHQDFIVDYRTVLVPHLVGEAEVREIASLLPTNAMWNFAEFIRGGCLNPEWNSITPYSREQIEELVNIAKSIIPNATLR
ncbi:MAG: anaerobic ribonucleoside-triphosphate reductase activating protein [Treponema sp.]